jgi:ABC-type transporter Mla MlaB component
MSFPASHSLYHVDCDVGHLQRADIATVDALARAHLNARRLGTSLCIVNASRDLRDLIALAGLTGVLLGRDGREAEEREEALGVEERGEADDLPV